MPAGLVFYEARAFNPCRSQRIVGQFPTPFLPHHRGGGTELFGIFDAENDVKNPILYING